MLTVCQSDCTSSAKIGFMHLQQFVGAPRKWSQNILNNVATINFQLAIKNKRVKAMKKSETILYGGRMKHADRFMWP